MIDATRRLASTWGRPFGHPRQIRGNAAPSPCYRRAVAMTDERRYDPKAIEPRWQEVWEREQTWAVHNDVDGGETSYVLEMLPYPSGEPHMGHLKNYSIGDAVAHFHRRTGRRVLHPMGYDAFGLPAENHAIRTGEHPRDSTAKSIASFQRQFRDWGISIDWTREFGTHEPRYYRWTQWIFLQLFERGLAYRKEAAVNWCPKDATVLANEQVIDGHCERCGTRGRGPPARAVVLPHHRLRRPAARRPRHDRVARARQDDAAQLDRPLLRRRGHVPLRGAGHRLPRLHHASGHAVRRDVLRHGARAPGRLQAGGGHRSTRTRSTSTSTTRRASRPRSAATPTARRPACRSAATVINPVNGEQIPMYVADYVLMEYGTGAIMAVPGPRRARLRVRRRSSACRSGASSRAATELPYTGDGPLVNSDPRFDGHAQPRGARGDRRLARHGGQGPPLDQLPAARLAALAPALLGLPDPDRLLRAVRDAARAGGPAAGRAARRRGLRAAGQVAAGRRRGLGQHDVPARAAAPPAARRTRWTRSSTRPGTSCATATPATTRPRGTPPSSTLGAGRPVHRRRRARDPAPHVRALLREGAARPRPARLRRAVRAASSPRA